jgi:hypothetical protein
VTRFRTIAGLLAAAAFLAAIFLVWLAERHPAAGARLRGRLADSVTQLGNQRSAPRDVSVQIDPRANGSPISPLIYGVAAADADTMRALGATLDRSGGNPSSTFNWAIGHAWNAGRDWQFRNVNYSGRADATADDGVAGALALGVTPLQTVPTMGWVARNDDNRTQSQRVPARGGPPLRPGSDAIAGYDPAANRALTSVPSYARKPGRLQLVPDPTAPAVYQDEYVHHLVQRFGAATQGLLYFAMDNEPDLWSSTHTDVHPVRMGYDTMLSNFLEYASMVKEQAPAAKVLGPDVSGWTGYLFSDLDRGADNFATHADRKAHGDRAFLPWWLSQVARSDAATGRRTLDFLDVHYYPQAQDVVSDTADPATQARRVRSVRGLYDRSYEDESWIATKVMLIPRLKQWIAENYPGTGLAITEYKWGGEKDASGAVAQTEVLGVFGREGVDLASYWTFPAPDSPVGAAFRLYRNYDGRGATFGDRSIPVASGSRQVAAFAARHSGGDEVDVVLANESQAGQTSVSIRLDRSPAYIATPYCVVPGSTTIEQGVTAAATKPLHMPPLGVCLIKLLPA